MNEPLDVDPFAPRRAPQPGGGGSGGRFTGRHVLVTGSSRGIGLAIARGFLVEGATVVLNGRDEGAARDAAAALVAAGHPEDAVRVSAFDVADPDAVEEGIARLHHRFGVFDAVVNNAGIQRRAPLIDMSAADFKTVIDIDLVSAFLVGRAVAGPMIEAGAGAIVNICSVQSSIVRPSTGNYAAAKTGLVGLTRSMCAEWAPLGIRANGIAPGYINTDLNAELVADEAFSSWITRRTPARRWGTVADVVGPTLWLCSTEAAFVNGQVLNVDGGMTAVI